MLYNYRFQSDIVLSIVIPIYKVEKYIAGCLDSIVPQICRNDVELILINDGTPDKSAQIAENLIKGYGNAHIFHQSNQGLSCARNNGLSNAKGDYVWFIDSDDSITENAIAGIIDTLRSEHPDLLQLNFQLTFENGKPSIPCIYELHTTSTGKEILTRGGLPAPAQFTIYRRTFLLENSLKFIPGILHEDSEFKPRVTYLASSVSIYTPITYNYLQRGVGNIMSTFKYKNAHDIIIGINNLLEFCNQYVAEPSCIIGFRRIIGLNYNSIIYGMRNLSKEDKEKTLALLKNNSHIPRVMIKSHKPKYVLEGLMLHLNIKFATKLYSILKE